MRQTVVPTCPLQRRTCSGVLCDLPGTRGYHDCQCGLVYIWWERQPLPRPWRYPEAAYNMSKHCYPPWAGGGEPGPPRGGNPKHGEMDVATWAENPHRELPKMADTADFEGPADSAQDILTKLNKHFETFWKKLEHKLHQPNPLQHTKLSLRKPNIYRQQAVWRQDNRPAPTTTSPRLHRW
ncbi:Hypothetical predicted protein [Pelobates cultripes]|uniref:Uncharacterized protein n=1 Tax=Pelobates cultripes TaxID=61616 RepID=A0AAD1WLU0_PELCU|nr:Hypothetical predicted protein [Pelobates cultripes]